LEQGISLTNINTGLKTRSDITDHKQDPRITN
jgi:hypothetical protein